MASKWSRCGGAAGSLLIGAAMLSAQAPAPQAGQPGQIAQPAAVLPPPDAERVRLNYVLGANDQFLIRAADVAELDQKAFKVDSEGLVYLPVVGELKASGLTVGQLEAELTKQLTRFYRNPRVAITMIQFRSDPVFLVGAFKSPGIFPLQGSRTLLEMLTVAGGMLPNASRRLRITRRLEWGRIPLPNAIEDKDRNISTAEISINRLMETVNPEEDIVLMAYDVVRVASEEMVYVSGEVPKQGGFPLGEKDSLSVMQVLALCGGLGTSAAAEKAKVMRPVLDTARRAEIPLDLKAIVEGRANDFPLLPNDVLVVPRSHSTFRTAFNRYAAVAVPSLVTSLIFISLRRN